MYALCLDKGYLSGLSDGKKYIYDKFNIYEGKYISGAFTHSDVEHYPLEKINAEYCSELDELFFFEIDLDTKKSVALTFDEFNYGYVDENKIFDELAVIKPVI